MSTIRVKGFEFPKFNMRKSSYRKAIQIKNKIENILRKMGAGEDDIEIPMINIVAKNEPASVTWYMHGTNLYYSYKLSNFIENLYIISQVLEEEAVAIENGEKELNDFLHEYDNNDDVEEERKHARTTLGVPHDCMDFEMIAKKYKQMAKEHHPDKGGDVHQFKAINNAHKVIKKELL